MDKLLADGNEAIAYAALDAQVNYVSHYPGSPVNRVVDVIACASRPRLPIINHALNEHIAALSAMGASVSGARSILVMKHVGLNIAADPLNYAGPLKIKGGLVIVVGTDPGARTSTGEEDVHWYAPQFNFPLLEPTSVQSIYDAVKKAFTISESIRLPVLVFISGRLAYQANLLKREAQSDRKKPLFKFNKNPADLINVGNSAVSNHQQHVLRLEKFARFNYGVQQKYNPKATLGVITRAASYALVCEVINDLALGSQVHLLNIEQTYPLNVESIFQFCHAKNDVIIIEDQDGFLETMIKRDLFGRVDCQIRGKTVFPPWGELRYQQVLVFFTELFDLAIADKAIAVDRTAPPRPGTFCEGCPHRSSFFAIDQALKEADGIIGGDIGCSSLPPHRTDWLLCMNAGVGMSQGIAQISPQQKLVSTGGEGSLFHGGLVALLSAVENEVNMVHILFDNRAVAMTGHQASPTTSGRVDVMSLLLSIGVKQVFKVNAFAATEVEKAINDAHRLTGVKVVWVTGDCALQVNAESARRMRERTLTIEPSLCGDCQLCYESLQCPAINRINIASRQLTIDMDACRRCGACVHICPNDAIKVSDPLYKPKVKTEVANV